MKIPNTSTPAVASSPPAGGGKKRAPRRRTRLAALAMVALGLPGLSLAAACNSTTNNYDDMVAKAAGFDAVTFVEELAFELGSEALKGFAATVTDRYGRTVARLEHGLARTSCDPGGERGFNAATETPWGSNSKIITTAAALHVAETFGVDLDDPIEDHLPFRWRGVLHPRFKFGEAGSGPVTLRMMLQHRGGFRHSSCGGRTIKDRLLDGDLFNCGTPADPTAAPPQVGTRDYANMSQGIFQILIAYMKNPGTMLYWENYANANGLGTSEYDELIQTITNNVYRYTVNYELFQPNGITGVCNMAEIADANPSGNYTLWYDSSSDTSGTLPSDGNPSCAAGAWSLSSNEMAKFLYRLRHTDLVISRESYALMEGTWTESLGWWKRDWDVGVGYSHNGAWGGTRAETRAWPGGFVGTYVTNSSVMGNAAGADLDYAFRQARKSGIARSMPAIRHGVL